MLFKLVSACVFLCKWNRGAVKRNLIDPRNNLSSWIREPESPCVRTVDCKINSTFYWVAMPVPQSLQLHYLHSSGLTMKPASQQCESFFSSGHHRTLQLWVFSSFSFALFINLPRSEEGTCVCPRGHVLSSSFAGSVTDTTSCLPFTLQAGTIFHL